MIGCVFHSFRHTDHVIGGVYHSFRHTVVRLDEKDNSEEW